MKKKLAFALLALTIVFAVTLSACNLPRGVLTKPNDVYGMGAVSMVKLLGSGTSSKALQVFAAASYMSAGSEDTDGNANIESDSAADSAETENGENDVLQQAKKFNEYFTALDSFLGEEIVSTTTEKNGDAEYDFDIKMTIKGKDISGNNTVYVMYYNETLEEEESEDGEIEREYVLEGVMVFENAEYFLTGERSFEQEEDETENKLEMRAYADKNDLSNYIEMEQKNSVETDESKNKFAYKVVIGNQTVEETEVTFKTEQEDGKKKTKLEMEFVSGEAEGEYEIKKEIENGKTVIKVEYDMKGRVGEFKIKEITDENGVKRYEYKFEDGSAVII